MARVFAISDLHTDYKQNLNWVANLSNQDYREDYLICAGDISHKLSLFTETLKLLAAKFKKVFFVPGNHDLWIRDKDAANSLEKFVIIRDLCLSLDIETRPTIIQDLAAPVVIFPLFSWYVKPEEGADSLYLQKNREDPELKMWVDNREILWPDSLDSKRPVDYFLEINEKNHNNSFKHYPVISFSHFLPRQDLIFSQKPLSKQGTDPYPQFNFTRVAGTNILEKQIKKLNSIIHVYGHLHRNRFRRSGNILYIAHILGSPKERKWAGIHDKNYFPKLIWSSNEGIIEMLEN